MDVAESLEAYLDALADAVKERDRLHAALDRVVTRICELEYRIHRIRTSRKEST